MELSAYCGLGLEGKEEYVTELRSETLFEKLEILNQYENQRFEVSGQVEYPRKGRILE